MKGLSALAAIAAIGAGLVTTTKRPTYQAGQQLEKRQGEGQSAAQVAAESETEMTNLEPVARAICTACGENPDHQNDARGNQYRWQDYIDVAQAAIAAVEPMNNMEVAALRAIIHAFGPDEAVTFNQSTWSRVHTAVSRLIASPPPPAEVPILTQDDIVQIILSSKHLPLGDAIRLTEKVVRQKAGL